MPIYDFKCDNCGHAKEQMIKSSNQPVECPRCGEPMIKQLSSPCFILHGVGCSSSGSFSKSKEGPKLDPELMRMNDKELDAALGYNLD